MTDRLTDLIVGLQRMAENARMRGDDLRYTQQQETYEHIQWLDELLGMVERVRAVFLEERKKFMPVEQQRQAIPQATQDKMPRVAQQGTMPHVNPLMAKEKSHG
jgi:hypothetical protein